MTDRTDELALRGQYDRERAMLAGADSAWNEAIERSLVIVRGHLALWTKRENPNAKISLLIDQLRQVESKICALKRPGPAPDEPSDALLDLSSREEWMRGRAPMPMGEPTPNSEFTTTITAEQHETFIRALDQTEPNEALKELMRSKSPWESAAPSPPPSYRRKLIEELRREVSNNFFDRDAIRRLVPLIGFAIAALEADARVIEAASPPPVGPRCFILGHHKDCRCRTREKLERDRG